MRPFNDWHTGSDSNVLHIATMSGVLACLMRHFRASVSSLPLLSAPVGSLPIGTWSLDAPLVQAEAGKPQQVRGNSLAPCVSCVS